MMPREILSGLLVAAALSMVALTVMATPAQAQRTDYQNMNCNQPWYERNLIYANRGY